MAATPAGLTVGSTLPTGREPDAPTPGDVAGTSRPTPPAPLEALRRPSCSCKLNVSPEAWSALACALCSSTLEQQRAPGRHGPTPANARNYRGLF